jgi:hypothetical protein
MPVQAHPEVERLSLAQNCHFLIPTSANFVGKVLVKFDWLLAETLLRDGKLQ